MKVAYLIQNAPTSDVLWAPDSTPANAPVSFFDPFSCGRRDTFTVAAGVAGTMVE